jgi:hypothetical protein
MSFIVLCLSLTSLVLVIDKYWYSERFSQHKIARYSTAPPMEYKQFIINQWWYSERFVVITSQLQAANCSLSSQLFGHVFTLLGNLRIPYRCTQCKQTFVSLVCSSLGPYIKNLLFNCR